jgi:zinc D-Ala-D-Ala carboxypeptidase
MCSERIAAYHKTKDMKMMISSLIFLSLWACQPVGSHSQSAAEAGQTAQPLAYAQGDTLPLETGFDLDYVMGKFDPATHPDFVLIQAQYANREGMYLHREAYDAFLRMHAAAKKEGLELRILSAARNFDYQKGIWEAKWTGARAVENGKDAAKAYPDPELRALKILEYSSMPGTSRHHWGTDMDLNALNNEYFETGYGQRLYQWLVQNAPAFGFCQPYTPKGDKRPDGYNEEKWHWSYLPLSRPLAQLAREQLKNEMIEGFKGAEVAVRIGVVQKYVLGINEECLPR